ncbi:hypothetical protein NAPIS_ORF01065 [Vairimorpha apis BRL 01]|uniref:Uncharacterized protein n=1 Tax=Vairimorpha apis BRL 01 TaxID=1037528 RepID=T0MDN2_9MICR|nr:hypothetical protein NAPIS_ORF01065 [Vairimorpha apis BRL 01]
MIKPKTDNIKYSELADNVEFISNNNQNNDIDGEDVSISINDSSNIIITAPSTTSSVENVSSMSITDYSSPNNNLTVPTKPVAKSEQNIQSVVEASTVNESNDSGNNRRRSRSVSPVRNNLLVDPKMSFLERMFGLFIPNSDSNKAICQIAFEDQSMFYDD